MKKSLNGKCKQVVFHIPAKDGLWKSVVYAAQDLCRGKEYDGNLYCGITIGWKEVWVFGKESTVFMTVTTTTHPPTADNKAHLAEVVKEIIERIKALPHSIGWVYIVETPTPN